MALKILVLNRNQRVSENARKVVVGHDDAALQGERSYDAVLVVVKLGHGTGAVVLQFLHLGQPGGVHQQTARRGPHGDRQQHEDSEQHSPDQLFAPNLDRGQVFEESLHGLRSE